MKQVKLFASTPHEGLPEVVENITPASIGGMGQVQLPIKTEVGSGDVPAGRGDAKKRYKKKMKFKHKIATYEEFLSKENSQINEGKFKAGQVWMWKHVDGDKEVEITNVKSNGDVVGKVKGTSDEFIVRDANKWLKKQVVEARDLNDPILMKLRAAQMKRDAKKNEPAKKEMSPAKVAKLRKLQAERAQIMRDMEQEAEMEGGPTADRYGKMLNKIDKEIAKLGGHGEKESVKEAKMPEPRKDEYYFSDRHEVTAPAVDLLHMRIQGQFADNSPPRLIMSETIKRWNETWEFIDRLQI